MKKVIISGLLAGAGIMAVSIALSALLGYLFPSVTREYQNAALFRPWSDPLMSLYYLHPFVVGMVLAFFWNKTKAVFKGKSFNRAVNFAGWYFLIGTIPGMLITYGSFQVSLVLTTIWAGVGFAEVTAAAWIFDRFNK